MRRLLVRLYPAAWRTRYGDEFEALLEERALGPFDVADVVLAAIDAHLHLRGRDAAPHRQRGFTMSLRLGGSAAIIGIVLLLTGFVATSIDNSDNVFPGGVLILVGTAALLPALVGLSAFQARQHPKLIWSAFVVPALGTTVSCVGIIAMAVVGDRPFVAGLSPWWIWTIGLFTTVLGSALFALATYHTRAISRRAAGLLAAGSGLLLAVMIIGYTGLAPTIGGSDVIAPALSVAGLLGFSIGWIALGWTAIRLDQSATATA